MLSPGLGVWLGGDTWPASAKVRRLNLPLSLPPFGPPLFHSLPHPTPPSFQVRLEKDRLEALEEEITTTLTHPSTPTSISLPPSFRSGSRRIVSRP